MKQLIITISIVTAIAFLLLSVISTWQIFTFLLDSNGDVRPELWILLIITFTGGVIMLGIAWGIAEVSDARRSERRIRRIGGGADGNNNNEDGDDDDE